MCFEMYSVGSKYLTEWVVCFDKPNDRTALEEYANLE